MPGKLYFYINFGTIKLNKKGSKVKSYGRPWLRDLEWEFFLNWEEARGFSGFSEDTEYTCLHLVKELRDAGISVPTDYIKRYHPEAIAPNNQLKKYLTPREYLRTTFPSSMGSPLHTNQARNLFMMGARGYGKSYSVGVGIVAHEFLFDGKTIYDPDASLTAAEIVMGAGDAKYSTETLDKTKTALDHLPGSIELNGVYYPNPFYKQFRGSWAPAKQIEAKYKKKVAGSWVTLGTGSNIKHRTFKDNPFAANGTRPGVMIWEEVGMFDNLKESYNASVECQRDGAFKFGSMMFLGTGGDMNGGGTVDAQEIFYTPEQYDCVEFPDIWEHRGKIGYFVPAYLGLNQFKDEFGNTDVEAAKKELEGVRNKYRKSKGSLSALEGEIVNRPLVPSEIFLQKQGNIFPVAELRQRLAKLQEHERWSHLEKKVELFYDPDAKTTNGVTYKIDTKNKLQAINRFPWKENSREGAVVIYEFPELVDNKVPQGAYIIGHDPYAQDDEGESCAVTIVMKTKKYFSSIGHDEVVAIHVARPYDGRHVVNETLYKLSLFYGEAIIYFENVRGNVKEYFEKKKRLDLLAKSPTTVMSKKASYSSSSNVIYGYPMSSKQMKIEGIQYVRD